VRVALKPRVSQDRLWDKMTIVTAGGNRSLPVFFGREQARAVRQCEKPTGRLLGACSGRRPMGYRFSLLTLLFSGVFVECKPWKEEKFRSLCKFLYLGAIPGWRWGGLTLTL
jgi:hypothetical protein